MDLPENPKITKTSMSESSTVQWLRVQIWSWTFLNSILICGVALIKLFDISELEFSHRGSGTNDGTDLHLGEYNSVNRSVNWQIDGICVGR